VPERADQPPPAVGRQVPGRPHVAHAGVDREDGVVGGQLVQLRSHVLRVDRSHLLHPAGVRVDDLLQRMRVVAQHRVQEPAVGLPLQQRQHRPDRLPDVPVHGDLERAAPAEV
jgi:hypothetical protein